MQKFLLLVSFSAIVWIFSFLALEKIGERIGIGINSTNSQLPGIYAYYPIHIPLRRGELVDCNLDFSQSSLEWIKLRNYVGNNKKLLKNIAAIPGDWLFTAYPIVYACSENNLTKNCKALGSCIYKDKDGLPLLCQKWWGKKIPNNYFYLQSNRVINSFDSRYFGLVSVKNIYHRLIIMLDLS